jgi:3-oxoacyl-[acyl-carrier protein] reductase
MNLKDKIAVVTGSSRGVGRSIALTMAEAGADVVVHCRKSVDIASEIAECIQAKGRQALVCKADVRDSQQVEVMFEKIFTHFGRIDILVNNAGHALVKPFLETTVDEWDEQFFVLPRAYYLCSRFVLPYMCKVKKGVILNIASTQGVRGAENEAAYGSANGAICSLTRNLAREFGPKGIRVNAILIAWATTEDNPVNSDDPEHRRFMHQLSLKHVTSPEEIAKTAVFLCSDNAGLITGVLLPVDSGYLS